MINVRFLCFDGKGRVYFFGYELSLTPAEYKILHALAEHGELSADKLSELACPSCTNNAVAVHISAINAKAEKISERRLVVCRGSLYRINEMM